MPVAKDRVMIIASVKIKQCGNLTQTQLAHGL